MTDRYDQDVILGYIEGELDDAQRDAFEAILAQDHELCNLVSQLRLDRQALRSLGTEPAPVGMIEQVMQVQERSALLGDPEAPESLPLTLPVSRHKLRRVLVYSGIAAVLLLSAAIVIPTLMPSALLNSKSHLASSTSTDKLLSETHSSLALADEDAVYDRDAKGTTSKSLARTTTTSSKTGMEALAAVQPELANELPAAKVKAESSGPMLALGDKTTSPQATPALASATTDSEVKLHIPAEAVTERADDVELAEAESPVSAASQPALALAAKPDPYMGYGSGAAVNEQTQLVINTTSPRQARRDLRSWALANNVRLIHEPAVRTTRGATDKSIEETEHRRTVFSEGTNDALQATPRQLIVEIDSSQVSQLVAYLNRESGQSAELLQLPMTIVSEGRLENGTESRQDQTNTSTREAKASSNRMVDTHSPWPQPSLVTGLTAGESKVNTGVSASAKQADQLSEDDDMAAEKTRSQSDIATAVPGEIKTFDWSQVFQNVTIQPVQPPTPLLQPEPTQRLRLEVIIQQVADDAAATKDAP